MIYNNFVLYNYLHSVFSDAGGFVYTSWGKCTLHFGEIFNIGIKNTILHLLTFLITLPQPTPVKCCLWKMTCEASSQRAFEGSLLTLKPAAEEIQPSSAIARCLPFCSHKPATSFLKGNTKVKWLLNDAITVSLTAWIPTAVHYDDFSEQIMSIQEGGKSQNISNHPR